MDIADDEMTSYTSSVFSECKTANSPTQRSLQAGDGNQQTDVDKADDEMTSYTSSVFSECLIANSQTKRSLQAGELLKHPNEPKKKLKGETAIQGITNLHDITIAAQQREIQILRSNLQNDYIRKSKLSLFQQLEDYENNPSNLSMVETPSSDSNCSNLADIDQQSLIGQKSFISLSTPPVTGKGTRQRL